MDTLAIALAAGALFSALIPLVLFLQNLPLFQLSKESLRSVPLSDCQVSVLIPARNEEASIASSVNSALASIGVEVEVIVMDDASADQTADVVAKIASEDSRVRLIKGMSLPAGWNGKQHACWKLASAASYHRLLFLDADVRLEPNAIAVLVAYQDSHQANLLSAFPKQETGTFLEKLLIPMMHVILLGYLPFRQMRASTNPAFAAGCGQLFLTLRSDYNASGTHKAIMSSRHDGLKLPRAYRERNLSTDVVDGTCIARCRMYHTGRQVLGGLLKNANEGIANRRLILVFSTLILGAAILPIVALAFSIYTASWIGITLSLIAIVAGGLPRTIGAKAFGQPPVGVVLHPLAASIFISIQWLAFAMNCVGKKVTWRGRI